MIATAVVLLIGIGGFGAGGQFNAKFGNKMMQLRLALQFLAVVLLMAFMWIANQGGQ
jgi:hypothetical protein